MASRIGRFIGMAAADLVNLFRGRQAIPCTVDWEQEAPRRPDVRAVFNRPVQAGMFPEYQEGMAIKRDLAAQAGQMRAGVFIGLLENPAAPTEAELNQMKPLDSVKWDGFTSDDCCNSCNNGCWH